MVNIAIFASGNGSNFEQIINEIQNGNLDNAICKILIVDKENAYARERSKRFNIPFEFFNPKDYKGK